MTKQILKSKVLVVVVLILAFTVSYSSSAFAWEGHRGHGHYSYRGGHWYSSGWFWGSFATALAVGTIVATLPPYHETVYVRGVPYYYYDSVYYKPCPSGYIVVPEPAASTVVFAPTVTQPRATSGETIVINIPNSSGGYTPVTLSKHKTGYIGPQGEYYEGHPTVEQLRALYGK